ncbi:MAG: YihY/virulence factor BrkB family protein, partial [Bacillota bacterium]
MARRLTFRELGQLVKCAAKGWSDDAASSMGAAVAFYTLFSLTPLLLVVIALAGVFIGRDAAENAVIVKIAEFVGEKAAYGIEAILDAAGTRTQGAFAAIAGIATLVIGATTVFAELRRDLDIIWRAPRPERGGVLNFLTTRALSFSMVMGAGLLLLGSLVASAMISAAGKHLMVHSALFAHAAEFVVSVLLVMGLFALIYKLLPSTSIAWSDVWVGSAVTSLLFWIGKFAIGVYIAKAAVGSSFGAAGAIVIVVAWVYYSSQVFFLGAEFTRQYAVRHG